MLFRMLPFAFVLFWSTGFIAAKYGLPYVQPFTFLAVRFVLVLLLLSIIILLLRPRFPDNKMAYFHLMIASFLIHTIYLGGVFSAIKLGLPAGITAVIVGLQPILTVFVVHRLQSPTAIAITLLGFIGLLLVLIGKSDTLQLNLAWTSYLPSFFALLGITFGTLYQKKFCADVSVISNAFIQYIPTCVAFVLLSLWFESGSFLAIKWETDFIIALLWLVVVLSIVAILLMNLLYQHNSASSAASYFYLSPPMALIMGYFLFDETIDWINLMGIVLVVVSVFMSKKLRF